MPERDAHGCILGRAYDVGKTGEAQLVDYGAVCRAGPDRRLGLESPGASRRSVERPQRVYVGRMRAGSIVGASVMLRQMGSPSNAARVPLAEMPGGVSVQG